MKPDEELVERWGLTIILGILFLIAVFFWVVIEDNYHGVDNFVVHFLRGICEAIAVAMAIGLTVDQFLSRRFAKEVFLASVGYVLPPELRPEMRWLCELEVLCTEDFMVCDLSAIGTSLNFHFHRTQVVTNITDKVVPLKLGLGIDQWFRPEKDSQILKYSFITEDEKWFHTGDAKKSPFGLNLPNDPTVTLQPGQEVRIISEFAEVYPRNGYLFMHLKYATRSVNVTVNCPDEIDFYVDFASRKGKTSLQVGNTYACPFTLLPYQRVAVRFWEKDKSAAWCQS